MERDAFLDALGDQSTSVRFLEKDPTTLDEALQLTCRQEAIDRAPPEGGYNDQGRRRNQLAVGEVESDRRVERLQSAQGDIRDGPSQSRD